MFDYECSNTYEAHTYSFPKYTDTKHLTYTDTLNSIEVQIHVGMHPHHLTNPSLFHICWKCPWSKVSLTWFPIWHSRLITDKTQRKWTSLSVFNYNYRNFVRGASSPPPCHVNYWQSSLSSPWQADILVCRFC